MDPNHNQILAVLTSEPGEELATTEIFPNYPEKLLQFALALCVIFILIGIPGNLVTITALAVCKKFRNATAIFIINLHISNLLFCCVVLPMTAITYSSKHWILGKRMCNVYALMKYSLNCTAHLTVVAITVNRYIIVCHPHIYPRLHKKVILIITLVSTWVIGFSLFLPSFFGVWGQFDLNPKGGDCTMHSDKNGVCPKAYFLVIAFVGPYAIFTICYSRIWCTVRKVAKNRLGHNSQVIQPTGSNTASNPSAAEKGIVCNETATYESGTDEDLNNVNRPIVVTPNIQENTIKQFDRNPFNVSEKKVQLQLPNRKDKKLATMIAALMVSFIFCHLPIMLVRVLYGEYKANPIPNVLVHLMEYSSVFVNPFIYVIMSTEYKQAYGKLFGDMKAVIMKSFNLAS